MEAHDSPWWQQGNLHDKTLAEWLQGESTNRLATALDILIGIKEDLEAEIHFQDFNELMRYVYEFVGCLDALAEQVPEPAEIPIPRAAFVAAEALGYLSSDSVAAAMEQPAPL